MISSSLSSVSVVNVVEENILVGRRLVFSESVGSAVLLEGC